MKIRFTGCRLCTFLLLLLSVLMIRSSVIMISTHIKCRGGLYPRSNIERFPVPDEMVSWSSEYREYQPHNYTSPGIHGKPWADPNIGEPDFNPQWNSMDGNVSRLSYMSQYKIENGYPLNPIGRTGISGRGILGRWGPNHAADPVVTRWKRLENGEIEKDKSRNNFYHKFKIPALGCIDGTHVAIVCPAKHEERFFNRKGYHSLNVMIICDSNLNILCVDASYPGSTHDSVVWANHPLNGYIERHHINHGEDLHLLVKRRDTGEWALPGGMVDPGEKLSATAAREFQEEAINSLVMSDDQKKDWLQRFEKFFNEGDEVYKGYIDDPRNTDNAWMESVAYNFHDNNGSTVGALKLHAGDDAVGVRWVDITPDIVLYASHKDIVMAVFDKLQISNFSQ